MTNQASTHDIIHEKREAALKSSSIPEGLFVSVCSAVGLACMFSGIWVGDGVCRSAIAADHTVMVMRVFTAAIYAVMLLAVFKATRDRVVVLSSFFVKPVIAGFVCFLAGIGLLLATPGIDSEIGRLVALWCALFLTKVIGAPLSIGLVCVFSQLNRPLALRTSAVGMLGAFLAYGALSQLGAAYSAGSIAMALCSLALLACAAVAGALGMNRTNFGEVQYSTEEVLGNNVVKRPMAEVVTKGFLIVVALSAMMLGYLRNGFTGGDSHLQPYSLAVLAILIAIVFAFKRIRIEHIFFVALISTATGILLAPELRVLTDQIAVVLNSMGTALFEVVVWTFVVWATHNSVEALRCAAVCRFCAVIGHLLGNVAVVAGIAASPSLPEATQAAGMIVIFAYFILLTILLKNPNLKVPLTVHESDGGYTEPAPAGALAVERRAETEGAPGADEPLAAATSEGNDGSGSAQGIDATAAAASEPATAAAEQPASTTENAAAPGNIEADKAAAEASASAEAAVASYEERYWTRPCKTIAATYRLTRRETEVLEHLAHGYSLASIEDTLCISRNTLKMHVRNLYAKLEVHSRQDVMSMVEAVRRQLG